MRKIIVCIAVLGILASCQVQTKKKSNEQDGQKSEENSVKETCLLKKFSFKLGSSERVFEYKYNGDTLVHMDMIASDKDEVQSVTYQYDSEGRIKTIDYPKEDISEFIYDESGRMIESKEKGNLMPRKFEWNDKGQIVKQTTLWNDKPYYVYEYSYDQNGNPSEMKSYNNKGDLDKTITFEYDDKINPIINTGAFANSLELFYGYPVGNTANNVLKIITTYQIKTQYKINGAYKMPGDSDTTHYAYEYNESGYPTKMFAAGKDTVNLAYMCE